MGADEIARILISRGFYGSPSEFEEEDPEKKDRILSACVAVLEAGESMHRDDMKFASTITRERQRLHAFLLRPGNKNWASIRAYHWSGMLEELGKEDPETQVLADAGTERWQGKVKDVPASCPWVTPGTKLFDAAHECLLALRVCLYTVEGGNYVETVERCRKVLGEALGQ